VAEGGALLRRYGDECLHRGFESLLLRTGVFQQLFQKLGRELESDEKKARSGGPSSFWSAAKTRWLVSATRNTEERRLTPTLLLVSQ
jgi:hypothetical protein